MTIAKLHAVDSASIAESTEKAPSVSQSTVASSPYPQSCSSTEKQIDPPAPDYQTAAEVSMPPAYKES